MASIDSEGPNMEIDLEPLSGALIPGDNDPRSVDELLLPLLMDLREWWDVSHSELAEAIEACSPRSALPS